MSEPIQKKAAKSKITVEWIDYSSQEQNEHHEEQVYQKTSKENSHNHQKLESKTFEKDKQKYLPVISSSHQPVKQHLIDDRKQQLAIFREVRGNTVWIQLSVKDQKSLPYLKQKIESFRNDKNRQIISIYPSRDSKIAFDLKLEVDLCQKWIVQGIDTKNIINLNVPKRNIKPKYEQRDNKQQYYQQKQKHYQPKSKDYQCKNKEYQPKNTGYDNKNKGYEQKPKHYQPKARQYEQNNRDYRPVKQSYPQHTASTRFQPKQVVISEQENQNKKKYIEKNPLIQKLEQKVEEQLADIKLRKDKPKKNKGSKFYSKNPFDFNESD